MTQQNQDLKGQSGQGGQTQFRQEDQDGQKMELDSGQAAARARELESRSFQGADADPVEGARDVAELQGQGDPSDADLQAGDEDKPLSGEDTQSDTSNT